MPIVEAVALSHSSGLTGSKTSRSRHIEEAMKAAVEKAYEDGHHDDLEKVRKLVLAAAKRARDELDNPKSEVNNKQ